MTRPIAGPRAVPPIGGEKVGDLLLTNRLDPSLCRPRDQKNGRVAKLIRGCGGDERANERTGE